MLKYAVRKLLLAIPLIFGVVTFTFILVELSPGDVADKFFSPDMPPEVRQAIAAKYQLDKPAIVRYLAMIKNMAVLEFGYSMTAERPVFDVILDSLPNTMVLSTVTLLSLYPTGIIIGSIQAIRHNTFVDTGLAVGSLLLYSMPGFWFALMLQMIVMQVDPTWPTSGMRDPMLEAIGETDPWIIWSDRIKHLLLPGVAMGVAASGSTARYMRSALLETIRQDYIRTARAKGLKERTVIVKHAMRNAMLPIITLLGLSVPFLFSGAVLTEMVFSWPGMGQEILTAILTQDTPVIIACFFVFTLLVVVGNLVADLSYAFVDPRIKYD